MNKCYKYLLILSVALFQPLQGQVNCDSSLYIGKYATTNMVAEAYSYPNAIHQKQFYNQWQVGDVYFSNGTAAYQKRLRYNGYEDLFIWMREKDNKTGMLLKATIDRIELNDKSTKTIYRKMNIRLPMQMNNSDVFMEEMVNGKVGLYCYRKIKYIKNSDETYYEDFQFFLQINNEFESVSLKKPMVLSKFEKPERAVLKAIAKAHKLKFNSEAELAQIVRLYNKQE